MAQRVAKGDYGIERIIGWSPHALFEWEVVAYDDIERLIVLLAHAPFNPHLNHWR